MAHYVIIRCVHYLSETIIIIEHPDTVEIFLFSHIYIRELNASFDLVSQIFHHITSTYTYSYLYVAFHGIYTALRGHWDRVASNLTCYKYTDLERLTTLI